MYDFTSVGREFIHYWMAFVRLMYPVQCLFCARELDVEEQGLCQACLENLQPPPRPRCSICADEIPPFAAHDRSCPSCRSFTKRYFTKGTAIFPYHEGIKRIVHEVKYAKKPWHLKMFRPYLSEAAMSLPLGAYDAIVPVPMDRKRRREREFNPAQILAKLLAKEQGQMPVRTILRKIKHTPPQSSLERNERLANVENTFRLKRGVRVDGLSLLLVDDVVTTGATMNECAKCLKEKGAERVDFFCLARTSAL